MLMRCLTILNLESKFMIDRTKYKAITMDLMIDGFRKEINRTKDIVQYHMINQTLLRNKLRKGIQNEFIKKKVEHQIHNNKIILRGLNRYIIELRSEMKDTQRRHPLNIEKEK